MKIDILVTAIFVALLMQGCATTISQEAVSVKLVGDVVLSKGAHEVVPPPDTNAALPKDCKLIGEVKGKDYFLFATPSLGFRRDKDAEKLIVGAKNDLRNNADRMGANVVHVLNVETLATGTNVFITGSAYKCP